MLVLSRKFGEKIYIGSDVVITIVDIDRGKVRLGISAPPNVPVHREEIRRQIEAEKAAASDPSPTAATDGAS